MEKCHKAGKGMSCYFRRLSHIIPLSVNNATYKAGKFFEEKGLLFPEEDYIRNSSVSSPHGLHDLLEAMAVGMLFQDPFPSLSGNFFPLFWMAKVITHLFWDLL